MTIDLISAKAEDFEPYVGQLFIVQTVNGPVELKLDNIKRKNPAFKRTVPLEIDGVVYPPREPFSLTFEGPLVPVLATISYTLKHESIGSLELFLSAFAQEADCTLYESALT